MNQFFKRATIAVASVALIGSAIATNYVRAADATSAAQAKVGQTAPGFTLEDQNGKKVSLSDYTGKVVVLEWTNPECPVVQRHYKAKTMTTLQDKYSKQDVIWLAVNSTSSATNSVNLNWAGEQSISYPILNDAGGVTGHAYGAKSTPDMYVIDKDGKLVYSGAIDDDKQGDKADKVNYVSKALDEVLAGKPVTISETASYGCAVHYAK
jgi:peroxiredoxin